MVILTCFIRLVHAWRECLLLGCLLVSDMGCGDCISWFLYEFAFFIALVPFVPLFLLLQLFQGLGNAGSRICKQTIMMARIDNSRIGRVNGVFDAIGMGVRVILLLLFTVSTDWFSTQLAFLSMAIISSGAILMIIANRSQLAFGLKRNTHSKPVRGLHDAGYL